MRPATVLVTLALALALAAGPAAAGHDPVPASGAALITVDVDNTLNRLCLLVESCVDPAGPAPEATASA